MSPGIAKLAFVAYFALHSILWSQSRYGQFPKLSSNSLSAQSLPPLAFSPAQCAPLTVPPSEQCAHIRQFCPKEDTFLSIPYLESYFCSTPQTRPLAFSGLVIWLIFLFSTLGISASDFFCPNLATLAEILGLDENVAGVTLLAFGNGSPDVFSTFSAMHADSGSLAIGELLGAATFIVSCVVGSICIIKEFKAEKVPFLRDVGFFTAAVSLLLVILWDGIINPWEAWSLIGLYLLYVLVVIMGSWWERRQLRRYQKQALIRGDDGQTAPLFYRDDPSPPDSNTLAIPAAKRGRAHSNPVHPTLHIDTDLPMRPNTRASSPNRPPHTQHMPSFSLIGALEFRQVVAELQLHSAGSDLNVFDAQVPAYAGGHYHNHDQLQRVPSHISYQSQRPRSSMDSDDTQFDYEAMGMPLTRAPGGTLAITPVSTRPDPVDLMTIPTIPTLSHTPASPLSEASLDLEPEIYVPLTRFQKFVRNVKQIMHVLFPTLHNFTSKSILGMIASLFAAPAVLGLTVTLPVLVTPRASDEERTLVPEGQLIEFEEEGIERRMAADAVSTKIPELQFNKWLMATQCILGSLFCAGVLFSGIDSSMWILIGTGIGGTVCAILVLCSAENGDSPAAQLSRCFMGFFVSVVWIMAIADEVVNVLKTFGFIFGLSDAIIGLTIFAIGNSLADFVANTSVAGFAPVMAFSACFGGPMLNMLIGIGISSSFIIQKTHQPYSFHFSDTLLVSTIGLLALLFTTMIYVPWNGFVLTKGWGVFLITSYCLIMMANILVELKH